MKTISGIQRFFLLSFLLLFFYTFQTYSQVKYIPRLSFQSQWNGHKGQYNSLWGWSGNGREYAILGSLDSIFFIDVTNPDKIKLCNARAGRFNSCQNREFKTYQHYCYAIGDQGHSSLQIFDLNYLPDSVHKVYDTDTVCANAHNLFFDHDRLYLAYNKKIGTHTDVYALTILSVANPEAPVFVANLVPPVININGVKRPLFEYVHDLYVRNDTAYCSCGYDGLFIFDLKNPLNPVLLASYTADNGALYNHSCWLSDNGNFLVNTDENNGAPVSLFDVSQLKDTSNKSPQIEKLWQFGSNADKGSTGHNAFFKGSLIYMSYYQDGVVVFDMKNPANVKEIASYDTYPQNNDVFNGWNGCWNIFPYFASGTIIASDITNGLFVLKMDSVSGIDPGRNGGLNIKVLNNPVHNQINLEINAQFNEPLKVSLTDLTGKELFTETYSGKTGLNRINIPVSSQAGNFLILKVISRSGTATRKLIVY
jgi:choice-of-anchor B domain-containing protein